ncbi:MAG TPA: GTP-binding protein, partial [Planctomycetota bacterium]|nr:GTP-binding protein [Planctomycetota bacterium]
ADPSPVVQSFFVDEDLKEKLLLDAVVTVVDARHVAGQLESTREAREQIAFADVVLLNKIDLSTADELDGLEARLRGINAFAKIYRTRDAAVDLDRILGIRAFDLGRRMEIDPSLLTREARHTSDLGSVALQEPGALDGRKLNAWLKDLLLTRGNDIFRMKGIVEVAGEPRRVVFQGVHMLFDGKPDRPWREGEDRSSVLVFIGRGLDRDSLRDGLLSCRA